MPVKSDIGAIVDMVKEGLSLWKTFIATRQEAYERKQDKKQVACIEAGENYIKVNEREGKWKSVTNAKRAKLLKLYYTRFFKYN